MADRQLDLFGEVVAGASATTLPNEISEARVPLIPHPIVEAVLDDDSVATECHGSVAVEPYRFTLTDPQGRWIITAAHEDEVKRGKVTRRMVGRCSCGWVSGFRLHLYGSTGPDLLVAHLRSHQLEKHPPSWQVDAERDGGAECTCLPGASTARPRTAIASDRLRESGAPKLARSTVSQPVSTSRVPSTAALCTTARTTGRSTIRRTTPANRGSRMPSGFSIRTGRSGTSGARRSTVGACSGSSARRSSLTEPTQR